MIETTHQANASQSYTLASRSKSRHTNQNLPKSMPAPSHARQKQCSKLIGKLTEDKEHQPLTSGIKHWGLSGYLNVSAPHQLLQRQTGTKPAIPNVSYTSPLSASVKNDTADNLLHKDRKKKKR